MDVSKGKYEFIVRYLPVRLAALFDYTRPSFRASWGGPFNGQRQRMHLFEEILRVYPFEAVIETGAFRGSTTQYLRQVTKAFVFTVEAQERFYHYCKLRFWRDPGVQVFFGDSRVFLKLIGGDRLKSRRVFLYLDAHWNEDLPVNEELRIISECWDDAVVMIDDFQVPDDPGYAFDDYGGGKRLSLDCIPFARSARFAIYWPATRSDKETGARRGCVVLATRGKAESALATLSSLRSATTGCLKDA